MLIQLAISTAELHWDNATRLKAENANAAVSQLSGALGQYAEENGAYPASLSALASAAGFEYVRPDAASTTAYGYSTTSGITDGVWQFSRAAVFTLKFNQGQTTASYITTNACGSGSATTASSWCGSNDSFWARRETRERNVPDLVAERLRQQRLMQKLVNSYNANQVFPNPGGSYSDFASLAGYAGTAKTCTGVFVWNAVPLDCGDLYSVWGTPSYLNYLSEQHIAIVSESNVKDASGNLINVATDFDLSTLL